MITAKNDLGIDSSGKNLKTRSIRLTVGLSHSVKPNMSYLFATVLLCIQLVIDVQRLRVIVSLFLLDFVEHLSAFNKRSQLLKWVDLGKFMKNPMFKTI